MPQPQDMHSTINSAVACDRKSNSDELWESISLFVEPILHGADMPLREQRIEAIQDAHSDSQCSSPLEDGNSHAA